MNNIPSLNALHSYGVRQQVNAHNVANVNTSGFRPSRVNMEEAPNRQGVEVQNISRQDEELRTEGQQQEQRETERNNRPSKTDLVTEFTQMLENKNAYNANAQAIRVNDQMNGELVNKLV